MHYLSFNLLSLFPADLDLAAALRFAALLAAGALVLGLLGRLVFGKRSGLNHAVSSALGILFVYAVTILIYTFQPGNLSKFLAPLPFVSLHGEYMLVFSFRGSAYSAICTEVLHMIVLAFLVNILDSWMPKGKKIIGWYAMRFVTVALALAAQLIVTSLLNRYLPGVLVTYAPMILIGVLAVLVLLGLCKVLLGLVLTVVNPILGAIYTFFFASHIGKMLGRAIVTTVLLCAVVFLLEYLGLGVITISPAALTGYAPLAAVLLILWFLIGHIL